MIKSLFGAGTRAAMLRGGLEESMLTQRGIAASVARATTTSSTNDFAATLNGAGGAAGAGASNAQAEVDVQQEMVNLADTQLRYEASVKLLQDTYSQLRTAIGRG